MSVSPYISFAGNAREVLNYYTEIFGSTAEVMTFGEMPPDPNYIVPPELKDQIMHAQMDIAGTTVMFSDSPPEMGELILGNAMSLGVFLKDPAQVKYYFDKMAQEGTITMPLEKTFWAELFGIVMDKFGVVWLFSTEE